MRRLTQVFCIVWLHLCTALSGSAGELEIRVVDDLGKSLPCRIAARVVTAAAPESEIAEIQSLIPTGAEELRIGPDRWFLSAGVCTVNVPSRKVLLQVEAGQEYIRSRQHLEIAGARTSQTVMLKRWIDMRSRGYLCGDSHLHVNADSLAPMLAAEGLDFGTITTWWNGPDPKVLVPAGSGSSRVLKFAGRSVPASVYDAEVEHAWGAVFIQNLPQPLTLTSTPDRPNLDFVKHAAGAGGMVHYQGGWSREVAVDALLGHVHAVQLCGNNFQPHRFQPRSRNSNLLQVAGFPVYPDTELGMLQQSLETYYRLLNWGLRLAASAGSSTGIKEAPAGYNRAYVRVAADATLDDFYRAWRAGQNFVTNGPMLFLKAGAGQQSGDQIDLPIGGGPIRVELEAFADLELTSAEIVVNGEVVATFPKLEGTSIQGTATLNIQQGSWIAARCMAQDKLLSDQELDRFANGDKQQPGRLRFAHTTPIYVRVGGRDAAVRKSLEEGQRMLDQFETFSRQTASAEYLPALLEAVSQAKQELANRVREAN